MSFQVLKYSSPLNTIPFFNLIERETEDELYLRLKGEVYIKPKILRCIGYFDGKIRHHCPNNAINTSQCPTCKSRDIMRIYTSFDFTGYEEYREAREKKLFAIYLTTFGKLVKAGVTDELRLEERIYEQGGGYYAKIAEFKGKKAYDFEHLLHTEFGIRGLVRREEKLLAIGEDDREGLEKMKEIIDMLKEKLPDVLLDNIEIRKHDYRVPKDYEIPKDLTVDGEVIGWRGQVFFVESDNQINAYHSRNYLGYEVLFQSSK